MMASETQNRERLAQSIEYTLNALERDQTKLAPWQYKRQVAIYRRFQRWITDSAITVDAMIREAQRLEKWSRGWANQCTNPNGLTARQAKYNWQIWKAVLITLVIAFERDLPDLA
jgi:hypothetical protein